jgi:heat shock protein HslJ
MGILADEASAKQSQSPAQMHVSSFAEKDYDGQPACKAERNKPNFRIGRQSTAYLSSVIRPLSSVGLREGKNR